MLVWAAAACWLIRHGGSKGDIATKRTAAAAQRPAQWTQVHHNQTFNLHQI